MLMNLRVLYTAVHVLIICAFQDGLVLLKLNDIMNDVSTSVVYLDSSVYVIN